MRLHASYHGCDEGLRFTVWILKYFHVYAGCAGCCDVGAKVMHMVGHFCSGRLGS
jgi:hypothetical protein